MEIAEHKPVANRVAKGIKNEWIKNAIENPDYSETQSDMRLRVWKKIAEADGKYLRVVLLEDHETIHNAFFDRRFKEEI